MGYAKIIGSNQFVEQMQSSLVFDTVKLATRAQLVSSPIAHIYGVSLQQLQELGVRFRQRLSQQDIQNIRIAALLCLAGQYLPQIIYYRPRSKFQGKFPSSISWTIRTGLPFKIFLLLSGISSMFFCRVFRRVSLVTHLKTQRKKLDSADSTLNEDRNLTTKVFSEENNLEDSMHPQKYSGKFQGNARTLSKILQGDDSFIARFYFQMFIKAMIVTVYARLGSTSIPKYLLHIAVALWYFLDNLVLMEVFDVDRKFRTGFLACTLGMCMADSGLMASLSNYSWRNWKRAILSAETPGFWEWRNSLEYLTPQLARQVFRFELLYQFFENALLTTSAISYYNLKLG